VSRSALAVVALLVIPTSPARAVEWAYSTSELLDQGRVVLDRHTSEAGVPAVQFDHAVHRTMFTCRVCHVELGMAMKVGETQISAQTNRDRRHCGACHDGKTTYEGAPIFRACDGAKTLEVGSPCARCHVGADRIRLSGRAEASLKLLPRDDGDFIDWNAAEKRGFVKPSDVPPGTTSRRPAMKIDRDFDIEVKGTWLGRVAFSHKKHAAWNGCEQCHPEIFPVTKRGAARYTMASLGNREFCGVCHSTVAFPISRCERCHENQRVRR
jgi:c(7)-type cytochrome triheme protein